MHSVSVASWQMTKDQKKRAPGGARTLTECPF